MRTLFALVVSALQCLAAPFQIQVEVVDEQGRHLPSAEITCDTLPVPAFNIWNAPARRQRLSAKTDVNGVGKLEGQHALPQLVISASRDGFYTSSRRVGCEQKFIQLIMVKKLAQVKSRRLEILTSSLPQDGNAYGFDLMMGAFTPPLGVGQRSDVFIKGKCASVTTAAGARVSSEGLDLEMRHSEKGSGFLATPRPGQKSFGLSIAIGCADQSFSGLFWPRIAPQTGYEVIWKYEELGTTRAPAEAGVSQWIFRMRPEQGYYYGVLTDCHWLSDGRLRLVYELSMVPGNPSLEFIK
jgi:hypothetical protein